MMFLRRPSSLTDADSGRTTLIPVVGRGGAFNRVHKQKGGACVEALNSSPAQPVPPGSPQSPHWRACYIVGRSAGCLMSTRCRQRTIQEDYEDKSRPWV